MAACNALGLLRMVGTHCSVNVNWVCDTRGTNLKDVVAFANSASPGLEVRLLGYHDSDLVAGNKADDTAVSEFLDSYEGEGSDEEFSKYKHEGKDDTDECESVYAQLGSYLSRKEEDYKSSCQNRELFSEICVNFEISCFMDYSGIVSRTRLKKYDNVKH